MHVVDTSTANDAERGGVTPRKSNYDVVVIGSGPNGLAAAIALAEIGCQVLVVEGGSQAGGGMRTSELTLPGFHHDVCSAVHPLAASSPFFKRLDLERHGLEWIHGTHPVAHPLEAGEAVHHPRELKSLKDVLGKRDGEVARRLLEPLVENGSKVFSELLSPPTKLPRHPVLLARMGARLMLPASTFIETKFTSERAQALFAGHAAHSVIPLEFWLSNAFTLMLGLTCHYSGWPLARGGSQSLADALVAHYKSLGGELVCGMWVQDLEELPEATAYIFDTSPGALATIAGSSLPKRFADRLGRFQHGPGAYKMDFALSDPIPWKSDICRHAATVHIGGTLNEIRASERAAWRGEVSSRPFVLLAQPTLFDPSRAPYDSHVAWAYCHCPNGSTYDYADVIIRQIERFAPGFRDTILETHTFTPKQFESYNPNYVGGDIVGGAQFWRQAVFRPFFQWNPYSTPNPKIFICSASTSPGAGVHGMCGYGAAQAVIKRYFSS